MRNPSIQGSTVGTNSLCICAFSSHLFTRSLSLRLLMYPVTDALLCFFRLRVCELGDQSAYGPRSPRHSAQCLAHSPECLFND